MRLLSVPHFAAQAPAVCKLSGLLERTKIKVLGALGLKKLSFYKVLGGFGRFWLQKAKSFKFMGCLVFPFAMLVVELTYNKFPRAEGKRLSVTGV